jgi:protease-4
MSPPPRSAPRRSPLVPILLVLGLLVLAFSVFINLVLLMVVASQSMGPSGGNLMEKRISGMGRDKIAVISVQGVISQGEAVLLFPTADMVETVRTQLEIAHNDDAVKAVILKVDSPGGTITASDLIFKEIVDFRKKSGKPVVVWMGSVAASGGYYISMAADTVVAHPTTMTGSIGVIMQLMNYKELTEKHGLKWETFVPANAKLKSIGSPSKEMTPEERAVFQNMVEKMYDHFVDRVVEGRRGKLTREQILTLANGQPYLGTEAFESGLVDKLGPMETAVDEAKALAGISGDPSVISYYRYSPFGSLFGVETAATGGKSADIAGALKALENKMTPRLLYLWCK